jgi:hypothetical protein
MPLPLQIDVVAERLNDSARDEYLYAGSVMQGVALGTAAAALFLIVTGPSTSGQTIGPWCASFAAVVVSHVTWTRGTLLTNAN